MTIPTPPPYLTELGRVIDALREHEASERVLHPTDEQPLADVLRDVQSRLAAMPPLPSEIRFGSGALTALEATVPRRPAPPVWATAPLFTPSAHLYGIPIRVDPALPDDMIAVHTPGKPPHLMRVTLPAQPAAPAPTPAWRRFLGRCRSLRRKPRP